MANQLHVIVVPHTHWDREWYQTFQQFRLRLVKTVDQLLDILDRDERFTHFLLDGQMILLDDYLEVRPEQEARLRHHIRAGRILVGPWYVQPDEFLVGGEALIRNLQFGVQRATDFGSPMRVGYVPDTFGHIAQLPQILRGCGIDSAVYWRGIGNDEARHSEFYWEAPDGSRVLVVFLADSIGYSNARLLPLAPQELATRLTLLAANILPKATTDTLLLMNGSDHLEAQAGLPAALEAANSLLARLNPHHEKILTAQHSAAHYDSLCTRIGTLPEYIEYVRNGNPELDVLDGEMRSSQHAHLLPGVLSTRMWIKQQNAATEQLLERWVEPLTAWAARLGEAYPTGLVKLAWRYLLQNHPHDSICGCSIDQVHRENRVRFAQSQQIGEGLLTQAMQQIASHIDTQEPFPAPYEGAEPQPIVVFNPAPGPRTIPVQCVVQLPGSLHNASIVDEQGVSMPYRVINRWRQEIGSMPVARDMLATAVTLSGITSPTQLISMAHSMIMSALGQSEDRFVISRIYIENYTESPLHQVHHAPQPGVVYIELMLAPAGRVFINEEELNAAGEQVLALLKDEDIHTLEVTLVDQARETIEFAAMELPSWGYKTFWLYPRGVQSATASAPVASSGSSTLIAHTDSIENEFYRVEVDASDATLIVTDKQTGTVYNGLNRFVDGGDVGDLYTYCPPENDVLVSAPLEPPRIELLNAGPVRATLRVSGRWSLPSSCTAGRSERSSRLAICPITSEISLMPGVRRVDIHTSIDNKVKDHRLRVFFPVPAKVERIAAEGAFEIRERPARSPRPEDVSDWAEEPVNTFPQKRFVDLSVNTSGLAVLNRGLPEYEVVDSGPGLREGESALALTLLRCVEWLSRGDLQTRKGHAGPAEQTPEAQCPGRHEFDYSLVPHAGDWQAQEALVVREAQAFNTYAATETIVAELHDGQLPASASLVQVEPRALVVSAIKRSEDGQGLVIRLYNPLDRAVDARIRPGVAFSRVDMANLLEEVLEPVDISAEQKDVCVRISRGSILTLIVR
ncbi:MAG: hypothetical protein J2P37_07540 [Ktedonobacteraceae bacterium]|nr:hypothetical protein [Ktedonobacteraceae bacterium]